MSNSFDRCEDALLPHCPQNGVDAFRRPPTRKSTLPLLDQLVPDFTGSDVPGAIRCDKCGLMLNKWDPSIPELSECMVSFDISSTLDGLLIASHQFRATYEKNQLRGLVFHSLKNCPRLYSVEITRSVPFDWVRRKTRFGEKCGKCGRNSYVVGAKPAFFKSEVLQLLANEFARSDLEFADGDEMHPLLICGSGAARALTESKLSGIEFREVNVT